MGIAHNDLRHSCATILTRLGINAKVIASILGYSNVRLTLATYTHADATMQRSAMTQLSERMTAPAGVAG